MTPDLQLGLWISTLVLGSGILLPPVLVWLASFNQKLIAEEY